MSQLSAQSIMARCRSRNWWGRAQLPMIEPFNPARLVVNGRTRGLGPASYDLTIAEDLTLGVHPGTIIANHIKLGHGFGGTVQFEDDLASLRSRVPGVGGVVQFKDDLAALRSRLLENPPHGALAHAQEHFAIPDNIGAEVLDKSTMARLMVSMFNTYIDPGFHGSLVLELVNHGPNVVKLEAGTPICQVVFYKLDRKTDRPYRGKYQGQIGTQGPILEQTP